MSNSTTKVNYDELALISKQLHVESEEYTAVHSRTRQKLAALQSEWKGQAAQKFFAEMDDKLLPAVQRVSDALLASESVLEQIMKITHEADEETASYFKSLDTGEYGRYKIGTPEHPDFKYDNGFLDNFSKSEPTLQDRLNLEAWKLKLKGAELLRPDLNDGTAAYRHFLFGNGADRNFSYEDYVQEDPSGKTTFNNVILEAQQSAEVLGKNRTEFSVTSSPYPIVDDARFPYPATENWQKAIGDHSLWTSADINTQMVDGKKMYTMTITFHAEDRYNFNPGAADIATGIPDDENGRFEVTELAHQYMNYGEMTKVITWQEGDLKNYQVLNSTTAR